MGGLFSGRGESGGPRVKGNDVFLVENQTSAKARDYNFTEPVPVFPALG